jgi:hypothetical protein
MKQIRTVLLMLAVCAATAAGLRAQLTFTYRTTANPVPASLPANGTILFPGTQPGASTTVTLIARNDGSEPWTFYSVSVTGAEFKITSVPETPLALPGLSVFQVAVSFTPTDGGANTGSLNIIAGGAAGSVSYNFFLSGTVQAANLLASYILNPDGNQNPLRSGDTISFPATAIRGTSTATIVIANRGNGAGAVSNVSLTGDQFRLTSLPLLPASVAPERDFRFNIAFTPVSRDAARGSVRIEMGGATLAISLIGQGTGAAFSYEFVTAAGATPVAPGGAIRMPDTAVGSVSSGVVRVRNTGNSDGRIGAVAVVGAGFRVADLTPLPTTVAQNGAFTFTVVFAPSQSGPANGQLLIDDVSIALNGTGVGAGLRIGARIGSTVTPVPDGGTITFPNTAIGSTSPVFVQLTNDGNAPAMVNGVGVTGAAFTAPELPPMPATIAPNQMLEFQIAFTPTVAGAVAGTLQIDDRSIPLRGTGNTPPPLPGVVFTNLPETVAALQQPAVGLALAEAYPLDLTGKLTLTFLPDSFADDPSIQFSSGGRTVDFRIPANSTQAVFGESARQVQFQSGTVAGVISVTASFTASAVNVTPTPAPVKPVTVPAEAPQLRAVQPGTRTANSFELLVSGFSTTRAVSQLKLDFAPAPGSQLQTPSLTYNVEAPFTAWYQSAAGRSFGSQFTVSVTVNVNGDPNSVQAVTVTASGPAGSSNPVTVNLR